MLTVKCWFPGALTRKEGHLYHWQVLYISLFNSDTYTVYIVLTLWDNAILVSFSYYSNFFSITTTLVRTKTLVHMVFIQFSACLNLSHTHFPYFSTHQMHKQQFKKKTLWFGDQTKCNLSYWETCLLSHSGLSGLAHTCQFFVSMLLQAAPILPDLVKPAPDLRAPPATKTKFKITVFFLFTPCPYYFYHFTTLWTIYTLSLSVKQTCIFSLLVILLYCQ